MSSDAGWYQRKMAALRGGQPAATTAPQQRQYLTQPMPQQPMQPMQRFQPQPEPQPEVTIDNFFQAMGHWHGGKAHKIDRDPCPECGSPQYYSRTEGVRRGPPPAPHCYNCGYNGMFSQGEPTTWGAV